MTNHTPVESSLINKLKRFLYVGLEENKYYPGCWISHKYFEESRLSVLATIITNDPSCQSICDTILKVYKDGLYTRYDTIAFALCKSLLLCNSESKMKLYKLAEQVCQTPHELFTFVDYTRKLKTGFGNGWCRTVGNWYRNKEPLELAADVSRVKGHRNQRHVNIVRKSHVKFDEEDHVRDAIIKYVMYGQKQARLVHGSHASTAGVLDYVQSVEELRHCEDPAAAAVLVREHGFALEHVPGHLLTSQEVWEAVLPNMPFRQLLSSLLRVHNMGFLSAGSSTTAILESLLTNAELVRRSGVTPLEVFIALRCYVEKKLPMKHPKMKFAAVKRERRREKQHQVPDTQLWVWFNDKPRHPKEHKYWGIDTPPSPAVENALIKTLSLSWPEPAAQSSERYFITMDMRDHMFKGRHFCKTSFKPPSKDGDKQNAQKEKPNPRGKAREAAAPTAAPTADAGDKTTRGKKKQNAECFYHSCVTPGDAALLVALSLLKRERDVTLAVFTEEGVRVLDLGRDRRALTLEKAKERLKKVNLGRVKVNAPMEWAIRKKMAVDVFINMIDRQSRYMELDAAERAGRGVGGGYGPAPAPPAIDHCPVRALEWYRQKRNMPHARLITLSLASHRVRTPDQLTEGVLDVVGVDEHVPRLIDAFAARLFE